MLHDVASSVYPRTATGTQPSEFFERTQDGVSAARDLLKRFLLVHELQPVPIEIRRALDAPRRSLGMRAVREIIHARAGRVEPLEVVLERHRRAISRVG